MGTSNNALNGETVILSSDDGTLILTNYRVKHEVVSRSDSSYKSIPIDKVAACALNTRSYPVLLLLAVVAVLLVFIFPELPQRIGAGVAAAVLVALYFGTRNGQIEVFSDSGESIAVPTKGLSHDQVKTFLEAVARQYQAARDGGPLLRAAA
ncbi:MAG: hypothetical protein EOP38_21145 [Rubrivivax sp.]|nr:MAG: hypothetical protein EOP38_21145 [Rubrivivax sp.]